MLILLNKKDKTVYHYNLVQWLHLHGSTYIPMSPQYDLTCALGLALNFRDRFVDRKQCGVCLVRLLSTREASLDLVKKMDRFNTKTTIIFYL